MNLLGAANRIKSYSYQVPWCVPRWGWDELCATIVPIITASVRAGAAIDEFAETAKAAIGRRHAIAVGRGRDAIWLALAALNVRPCDEVVLPGYVCRSVLEAVEMAGATPVFADIGEDLHVSAQTVERAITPKTRCIVVPHLFGNIAPINDVATLAARRGIALIDDAAQAYGCAIAGRPAGSYGEFGIVCGGPGKPLAAPSGALLLTDDDGLYETAMRLCPRIASAGRDLRETLDFWLWRRFRRQTLPLEVALDRFGTDAAVPPATRPRAMTNLQASLLRVQARSIREHDERRRAVFRRWLDLVAPLAWTPLTRLEQGRLALKGVFLLPPDGRPAEAAVAALAEAGIEAQRGYVPCHSAEWQERLPVTERTWRRVLCIPLDTPVANEDRVRAFVRDWLKLPVQASANWSVA